MVFRCIEYAAHMYRDEVNVELFVVQMASIAGIITQRQPWIALSAEYYNIENA